MATYLIINVLFLALALVIARASWRRPSRAFVVTLVALCVLTAVFDNVIVGLGIVAYDQQKILGVMIGKAPIEDFFYAVVAVILVPHVWQQFGKRGEQ